MVLAWGLVVAVLGDVLAGGEVDVTDGGEGWGGLSGGGCDEEDAMVARMM